MGDQDLEPDPVEQLYRDHGMHPGWLRVWSNGVDVTDEPEKWPELWRDPKAVHHPRRYKR